VDDAVRVHVPDRLDQLPENGGGLRGGQAAGVARDQSRERATGDQLGDDVEIVTFDERGFVFDDVWVPQLGENLRFVLDIREILFRNTSKRDF
jgi:hypothetical protein